MLIRIPSRPIRCNLFLSLPDFRVGLRRRESGTYRAQIVRVDRTEGFDACLQGVSVIEEAGAVI